MSLVFKTGRELVLQMSGGKEFQSWGAEWLKLCSPWCRDVRGDSEAEGRGGSKGACWSGDAKGIRQVRRGEVVNSF